VKLRVKTNLCYLFDFSVYYIKLCFKALSNFFCRARPWRSYLRDIFLKGELVRFQCLGFHLQLTVRINLIFQLCILILSRVRVRVAWDHKHTRYPECLALNMSWRSQLSWFQMWTICGQYFPRLDYHPYSGEEPGFLREETWTLESGRRKSSLIFSQTSVSMWSSSVK